MQFRQQKGAQFLKLNDTQCNMLWTDVRKQQIHYENPRLSHLTSHHKLNRSMNSQTFNRQKKKVSISDYKKNHQLNKSVVENRTNLLNDTYRRLPIIESPFIQKTMTSQAYQQYPQITTVFQPLFPVYQQYQTEVIFPQMTTFKNTQRKEILTNVNYYSFSNQIDNYQAQQRMSEQVSQQTAPKRYSTYQKRVMFQEPKHELASSSSKIKKLTQTQKEKDQKKRKQELVSSQIKQTDIQQNVVRPSSSEKQVLVKDENGCFQKLNKCQFRRIDSINFDLGQEQPSLVLGHYPAGCECNLEVCFNDLDVIQDKNQPLSMVTSKISTQGENCGEQQTQLRNRLISIQ